MPILEVRRATLAMMVVAGAAVFASTATTTHATTPQTVTRYVCSLTLTIKTGGDDLRGGDDNLHGWVRAPFGTVRAENWLSLDDLYSSSRFGLNGRHNWGNWTTHSVTVRLPDCSLRVEDIKGIRLSTHPAGGISGDNWNMQAITVAWTGHTGSPGSGPAAHGVYLSLNEPRRERFLFRFTGLSPLWQNDWAR